MKPRVKIKIETGVAAPVGRNQISPLGEALLKMKLAKNTLEDESVTYHDQRHPYWVARKVGVKIRTAKTEGGGCRIWRIK